MNLEIIPNGTDALETFNQNGQVPALILMGRDNQGRAHASTFALAEIGAAERAAELMGLHVLMVCEDEHRNLAAKLPKGRLFKSNRAFVPFVKVDLFSKLLAAAGVPDAPKPIKVAAKPAGSTPAQKGDHGSGNAAGGTGGAHRRPLDWDEIGIGSLVLATTGGPQEGWFEAVVTYTKADRNYILEWRDWAEEPEFSRHASELALLHPGNLPIITEA